MFDFGIVVSVYGPVLKTGEQFEAEKPNGERALFEFVGFAPFENTGCSYLILKNVATGEFCGVERIWFDTERCGRKIFLTEKEGAKK